MGSDKENILEQIPYETFAKLLKKTLEDDKKLYDMLEDYDQTASEKHAELNCSEEPNRSVINQVSDETSVCKPSDKNLDTIKTAFAFEVKDLIMKIWFDEETRFVDFAEVAASNIGLNALNDPTVLKQAKLSENSIRWDCVNLELTANDLYKLSHLSIILEIFEHLKSVSVNTRLIRGTDPESGVCSLYILARKRSDISWDEYDRVVVHIYEQVCRDYVIVEDYTK